jgi:uncharacterized membrane-anchored protein YitT (DUF2179 family)
MRQFFDYIMLTIGSIIVAVGLELILAPNGLVDGGVTALSIMANRLWEVPIWAIFMLLNFPTLIYCITNRFMYPKLKDVVLTIDPSAVLEASYVSETAGVKKASLFRANT